MPARLGTHPIAATLSHILITLMASRIRLQLTNMVTARTVSQNHDVPALSAKHYCLRFGPGDLQRGAHNLEEAQQRPSHSTIFLTKEARPLGSSALGGQPHVPEICY